MVNGKWLPDFIERLKASAWHQLYLPLLPFTHAISESINADSLKLQLLTARKKEWWPATADSLPQAVYLTTVKYVSGNRTHDLSIVSPTRYQLCHRDHQLLNSFSWQTDLVKRPMQFSQHSTDIQKKRNRKNVFLRVRKQCWLTDVLIYTYSSLNLQMGCCGAHAQYSNV